MADAGLAGAATGGAPAAGAVAERTTEERLTHALGVVFATRPDGKAREIVGVSPEAMELISTRRHKVTAKAAELVDAFETRYGRAPNGLERDRLAQQATLLTRRGEVAHRGDPRAAAGPDRRAGSAPTSTAGSRGSRRPRWPPAAAVRRRRRGRRGR